MSGTFEISSNNSSINIKFELLGSHHNRAAFSCGNTYIDAKLNRDVLPLHELNLTRAFVAVEPGHNEVLGFYSMVPHEIEPHNVPSRWSHLVTDHTLNSIPAVYIPLFATKESKQGRGIGKLMMGDALRRIKKTSEFSLPVYTVVLDAANQRAFDFYEKIGFRALNDTMRMFYRVADIP